MELLILNGSPKQDKSNTLKLTQAFVDGLKKNTRVNATTVNIYKKKIHFCLGCYSCWHNTSGACVLKDDAAEIIDLYLAADLVIWNTPVHTFGVSSGMKTFMDRLIPIYAPGIVPHKSGKGVTHPARYDLSTQRHVLIASCGFPDRVNNTDAVVKLFDIVHHDKYNSIIVPQGDLFGIPQMGHVTKRILNAVHEVGRLYGETGVFPVEKVDAMTALYLSNEDYIALANENWLAVGNFESMDDYHNQQAKNYIRQMGLIYEPEYMKAQRGVLQIELGKGSYLCQMVMTPSDCTIVDDTDQFVEYTLKITTDIDRMIELSKDSGPQGGGKTDDAAIRSSFQSLIEMVSLLAVNGIKKELRL
jgi:multimeric flavodoxin WrbA